VKSEARCTGFVFGDGGGCDFVGEEIFAHFGEIWRGESDFGEEIVGGAAGNLLELDALAAVDGVARIRDAQAGGRGGVEAEDFGVEGARGVEIGGVETDGGDAGDFGAREGLRRRERINTESTEEDGTEDTEKRKTGRRKTEKRKTEKRKTEKRKTEKRKTEKRKTEKRKERV